MTLDRVAISIDQGDTYSPDNLCDFPKRIMEACLTRYSKTINSFSLSCKPLHTVPIQLIEMENIICNLVELVINSPVSVELDTFLSLSPRLKSLELFHTDIKVRDNFYTSKRFGLQEFRVNNAKITSDVLRFL
ncbi:hypothetical protein CLU79DRAFT_837690 [Phycomyces nitens]|nr:hypothetical protein CLU79DRAFT_837690 [Phycomyces nitens]